MDTPTRRLAPVVRSRCPAKSASLRRGLLLATLAAVSALGGCEPRPSVTRAIAEITTREGATFIVVEPQAYYLRACNAGQYPLGGDPDASGLRAIAAGADANKQSLTSGDEIPWSTIDSIVFAETVGELNGEPGGEFCDGPQSIAATVRLRDGSRVQKHLIDTTDRGIEGKSARGDIVIPIRDIVRLRMIDDRNWAWASRTGDDVGEDIVIKVRISNRTGGVREATDPETTLGYEKRVGNRTLSTPVEERSGFPAVVAGARILIPWNVLRAVEIRVVNVGQKFVAGDAPLAVHLVYADGHVEDVGARNCAIDGTSIDNLTRIDIATLPSARSKPL